MILHKLVLGHLKTNCYILINEDLKEAIIFDVPACGDQICDFIEKEGCKLRYIILTHEHFDHVLALDYVKNRTDAKILTQSDVKHGEVMQFGDHKLKFLHTPGHTLDSMCILLEPDKMLFTGDTLFRGTIGRTDLPGGNLKSILRSITEILLPLEDDLVVYPGHGLATTIAQERSSNLYFK